jgi:hypothetical protein
MPNYICRTLDFPHYGHFRSTTLLPLAEGTLTRVAIYARVSTADKGQDPENQLRELGLGL